MASFIVILFINTYMYFLQEFYITIGNFICWSMSMYLAISIVSLGIFKNCGVFKENNSSLSMILYFEIYFQIYYYGNIGHGRCYGICVCIIKEESLICTMSKPYQLNQGLGVPSETFRTKQPNEKPFFISKKNHEGLIG